MQVIGGAMLMWALRSIAANSRSYFGGWNLLYLSVFILYNCYQLWTLGRRGGAAQHPGYDMLRAADQRTLLGRATGTQQSRGGAW